MGKLKGWAAVAALMGAAACGGNAIETFTPPTGVSLALIQLRDDVPRHRMQVAVTVTTDEPVRFEQLQLITPSFSTVPPQRVDYTMGRTPRTDLPMPYGTAKCDPKQIPAPRAGYVTARMSVGGGPVREVRFPVPASDKTLAQLVKNECGQFILNQSVDVIFGESWERDGRALRGALRLGVKGPVTIDDVGGTTHYNLVPRDGKRHPVTVTSGEISVELTPARCDAHAFAEAKQAYLFSVWGHAQGGETYRIQVVPPVPLQERFLAYAKDVCDVPS